MSVETLVVDASVAFKWLVEEDGTLQALELRRKAKLIAPDLLAAECANILWKKVRRGELQQDEALLAAKVLQAADIEWASMRSLLEPSTRIAIEIDHPAYDCLYLALAIERDCRFVTADQRLLDKLRGRGGRYHRRAVSLSEAAAVVGGGGDESR